MSIDKNSLVATKRVLQAISGFPVDELAMSQTLSRGELDDLRPGDGRTWEGLTAYRSIDGRIILGVDPELILSEMAKRIVPINVDDDALCVGPRHERANTAFIGDRMIARKHVWDDLNADPSLSFEDARGVDGHCVVFSAEEERNRIADAASFCA